MALGEQVLSVLVKTSHDSRGFDDAESGLSRFGGTIGGVGKTLMNFGATALKATAVVTGLAAAAGVKAVSDFGKFNESIQRAGAFANATAEETKMLEDAVLAVGKKGLVPTLELADAMGALVGGEIDAKTAAAELEDIVGLKLVAKMGTMREAIDLSSLALTVFKDDLGTTSALMDRMAVFAANVDDQTDALSRALQQSAGSARAAGVSFDELITLFSVMRRSGIDLDLTWAAFNSAMTAIQSPGEKAFKALEKVGFGADDLSDALKLGTVPFLEVLRVGFEKAGGIEGKGLAFLMDTLGREAAPKFATALSLTNEEMEETAGWFEDVSGKGKTLVEILASNIPLIDKIKAVFGNMSITVGKFLSEELGPKVIALKDTIINWIEDNKLRVEALKIQFLDLWKNGVLPLLDTIIQYVPAFLTFSSTILGVVVPAIKVLIKFIDVLMGGVRGLTEGFNTLWSVWEKSSEILDKLGGIDKKGKSIYGGEGMMFPADMLPQHDSGGIVAGPIGSPQLIVAHGGETVLPTHRDKTIGTQNVTFNVTVRNDIDLQALLRKVEEYLGGKSLAREFGIS